MMQQLEAAFGGVWVGGQRRRDLLLTHAEPQSLGVSARAHLQIDSLPSSSFHCAAVLGRKAGRPMHGACSTYYTQSGSPSSGGQPNVIVRFHLRFSKRSCDSIQVLFNRLED